ncbi:hypothetical protein GpartN1_g6044.t1 [Galdieria partita]|uniref:Uncharacterized protein n=1 Tax=Galdieria partita TaxID=83374 RepID=A0A9C7Q0L8_9RHOD|nr:hypothetical protein GpartN1_g6044.t1 [Galdieria partita]
MSHHDARLFLILLFLCLAFMLVQSVEEQEKGIETKKKIETLDKQLSEMNKQMESSKRGNEREIRRLKREIEQKKEKQKNSEGNLRAKETEVNQLRAKLDEVQRELLILEAKSNNPQLKNVLASVLKNFEKYLDPHVALAFEATHEKMQSLLDAANDHSIVKVAASENADGFSLFGALLTYGVFFVPLTCCFYGMFRISAKLRLKHYVLMGNIFCLSFCLLTLVLHVFMGESPFESFRSNDQNSVIMLVIFICFLCALSCAIVMLALLKSEDLKEALFYAVVFPLNCSLGLSLRNRLYYPIVHHEPFELSVMFLLTACFLYSCEILIQYAVLYNMTRSTLFLSLNGDINGDVERSSNNGTPLKKVLITKAD